VLSMEIPVGFAQVSLLFKGPPIPLGAACTFGVQIEPDSPEDPLEAANRVWTAYTTSDLESVIGSGADLQAILVKYGPSATGPSALRASVRASDGGTPCDSPAIATLVHKNTLFGGRAGRGRMYLPCPPDAGVGTGGALDPTFVGQVNSRLTSFRTSLVGSDLNPVLLHGPDSPLGEPSGILSFTCDPQVGTQRRRNRR